MAARSKEAKAIFTNVRLHGWKSATVFSWQDGDKVVQVQRVVESRNKPKEDSK